MEDCASRAATDATVMYSTQDGRFLHAHGAFESDGICAELVVKDPALVKIAKAIAQGGGLGFEHAMFDHICCGAMRCSVAEWGQHKRLCATLSL
jgi:hypothetical protein